MFKADGTGDVGGVTVMTSENGGHSPEQIADLALNKIMMVSENAPPVIRDQAIAHREKLREILIYYMNKMAQSERTTLWALFNKQGHGDMAEIIRRL
jgi:hypothetical protein|tara:strand:- start:2570 stop:2860 length:291 start_codon:yes stop_codon:yes gene_type:complete